MGSCTVEVSRNPRTQFASHESFKHKTETAPNCLHLKYKERNKRQVSCQEDSTVLLAMCQILLPIFSVFVKMKRGCDVLKNKLLRQAASKMRISKFSLYLRLRCSGLASICLIVKIIK